MTAYYGGIGSRKTPPDVLDLMRRLGAELGRQGYVGRSGGADGADTAFEDGARSVDAPFEFYLPWAGFNGRTADYIQAFHPSAVIYSEPPSQRCYEIAERHHPSWSVCSGGARKMHARNVCQVLGPDPDHPVLSSFIVCWTPDGSLDGQDYGSGGTGQALRIARTYGVGVQNLARPEHRETAENWLTMPQERSTT